MNFLLQLIQLYARFDKGGGENVHTLISPGTFIKIKDNIIMYREVFDMNELQSD